MSLFTPWHGLAGGSLIGLAAGTLLLGNGDIMGASGIAYSVILSPRATFRDPSTRWKILFISSFLLTSSLLSKFVETPEFIKDQMSIILSQQNSTPIVSKLGFAIGGFLVGLGTKLGNGCTSGHGVCGLARFSKRSAVAVLSFMTTGLLSATAFSADGFLNKYLRIANTETNLIDFFPNPESKFIGGLITAIVVGSCIPILINCYAHPASVQPDVADHEKAKLVARSNARKGPLAMLVASAFANGLEISGMTKLYKIFNFLNLKGIANKTWDGTLILVMVGGVLLSTIAYHFVEEYDHVIKHKRTLRAPFLHAESCVSFNIPKNTIIDKKLLLGSAIFGLGWGIAGLCPGPALYMLSAGYKQVMLYWWPANILGAKLADMVVKIL